MSIRSVVILLLLCNISFGQYTSPFISEESISTTAPIINQPKVVKPVITPGKVGIDPKTIPSTSPWTYPGDITSHLLTGHGLTRDQINGLSKEEQVKLHNYLHNKNNTSSYVTRRKFRLFR